MRKGDAEPLLFAAGFDLFVPLFNRFEQHGSELLQVDQLRDLLFGSSGEEDAPYPHHNARRTPPSSGPGSAATRSPMIRSNSSRLRPLSKRMRSATRLGPSRSASSQVSIS